MPIRFNWWRKRTSLPWTPIVGPRAAIGLEWLEKTAGERAVQKFLGGKIRGTPFSGQYVVGIVDRSEGRKLICDLLDGLRQGKTIPLCDVGSYYAHGKRWSLGMAIYNGRLVDVYLPEKPSRACRKKRS